MKFYSAIIERHFRCRKERKLPQAVQIKIILKSSAIVINAEKINTPAFSLKFTQKVSPQI